MDPRVSMLAEILRMNTRLFNNCLAGMSEEQAHRRPTPTTNSAAFVAAHVADARYFVLGPLGAAAPSPLAPYVGEWKSIDQVTDWPTLDQIRTAWTGAAEALDRRLATITAAELDDGSKVPFSVGPNSILGFLTFMVQHDSHHIGQLASLRKFVGLPAMSYD